MLHSCSLIFRLPSLFSLILQTSRVESSNRALEPICNTQLSQKRAWQTSHPLDIIHMLSKSHRNVHKKLKNGKRTGNKSHISIKFLFEDEVELQLRQPN